MHNLHSRKSAAKSQSGVIRRATDTAWAMIDYSMDNCIRKGPGDETAWLSNPLAFILSSLPGEWR
jgi:hypothetical protein